jgi:hypothetical protein
MLAIPNKHEHGVVMKVISVSAWDCGGLQAIPFVLGERGRGRWEERVEVSNRPGQTPSGPEDVGFLAFGQGKHIILVKANPAQRGVLMRVNTKGTYTRNSFGRVKLEGGEAHLLAKGTFAQGEAGNVGGATDELWHVESPALFTVHIEGGDRKELGKRLLIVTRSFRVVMMRPADLCHLIATDNDPEVSEVCRTYRQTLPEDVQASLELAERLDAEFDASPAEKIHHLSTDYKPIERAVQDARLGIPPAWRGEIRGVSGVENGILMPGNKALVALQIGIGGGRQYTTQVAKEAGITRLDDSKAGDAWGALALIDDPSWVVAWADFKNGEAIGYSIANGTGVHRYALGHNGWLDPQTTPWVGVEPITPGVREFRAMFGLDTAKAAGGGGFDNPFAAAFAKKKKKEPDVDW